MESPDVARPVLEQTVDIAALGFMGGHDAFSESLLSGMRETLARIKTAAEA